MYIFDLTYRKMKRPNLNFSIVELVKGTKHHGLIIAENVSGKTHAFL